jgi:hypothetical protein
MGTSFPPPLSILHNGMKKVCTQTCAWVPKPTTTKRTTTKKTTTKKTTARKVTSTTQGGSPITAGSTTNGFSTDSPITSTQESVTEAATDPPTTIAQ